MKKLLITAAALGLTVGFVATASATNGYFAHGYSIKSKGMAGAGVAAPMDSMVVCHQPSRSHRGWQQARSRPGPLWPQQGVYNVEGCAVWTSRGLFR